MSSAFLLEMWSFNIGWRLCWDFEPCVGGVSYNSKLNTQFAFQWLIPGFVLNVIPGNVVLALKVILEITVPGIQ